MKHRILIVEDNVMLADQQKRWLEKSGYGVSTTIDEPGARKRIKSEHFDLVLADVRLPEGNGISLLEWLRKEKIDIPFIVMTGYASVPDAVRAIKLGADDYLAKPFHLAELHARIRSVLRRNSHGGTHDIRLGNVTVHTDTFTVDVDGKGLELGRKEYDILHYLVNRANRLIDKQTLAEAVWGDDADQADNFDFVYAQMKNLRKRLKQAGASIEIKTVYGFGYKLVEG